MKRFLAITLGILLWGSIATYTVFAVRECSDRKRGIIIRDIEIVINDTDEAEIVSPSGVRELLDEGGFILEGQPVTLINTGQLEEYLVSQPFIKTAVVHTDISGKLTIEVSQRRPVSRIITSTGNDFYISADSIILPHWNGSLVYVPVVTGNVVLPFPQGYSGALTELSPFTKKYNQNYRYLLKLINFVKMLADDLFWAAQLVQIEVNGTGVAHGGEPIIELVTRVGNQRVIFGELDGKTEAERLDKLMVFYEKIASVSGWDTYSQVELQYRGQIVCRRD